MRPFLIAAVVVAQLPLAPLAAADIDDAAGAAQHRAGTFAGARFRVPFGGQSAGKAKLGLGVAGVAQSRLPTGATATAFAEGVQFELASNRGPALNLGGRRLAVLGHQEGEPETEDEEKEGGLSTLEVVGLVAGGVLVAGGIGLALLIDAMNDASE
jgi:hypothetical protein